LIALPGRVSIKLVIGIAAALTLALLVHDRNRWKAKAEHYTQALAAERAAHSATIANYRAAAERARLADAANIERVEAEQDAINERTVATYESRIAAARALADRLQRDSISRADPGGRPAPPVPGLSGSAGGADEASGKNRLPLPDAILATEQAIQLDELIKWVRLQAAVERDGAAEARLLPRAEQLPDGESQ